MKKASCHILLVLALATPLLSHAQAQTGIDGVIGRFQQFYNNTQYDSIFSMLSPRSQAIMPQDKIKAAMGQLRNQVGSLKAFERTSQDDKFSYYKASFANADLLLTTSVNADNKLEAFRFGPYKEVAKEAAEKSDIVLSTPTGKIFGSLTMPEGGAKVPVVLLIAGSGPTDRRGNNPLGVKSNTYKMIADSLQKAGIACVRYDKRGIGESRGAMASQEEMNLTTYINDAAGFVKMLKEDSRFSEVIIAGHSEGSLIGMVVARQQNVKKYISISGAGERLDNTLKEQITAQWKDLVPVAVKIMDSLKKGFDVKYVPEALEIVFSPSLQPFIRSLFKYDPQVEIKKLQCPVLILQGDNDLQVALKNAQNLKKAQPKAKLVVIKKMNHALKDAPADRSGNMATYTDPSLPLSAGLASAMAGFIKAK